MNPAIQLIEDLLELYYSGESAPAQNARLQQLLASTPGLPPYLEAERRMFAALASLAPAPPARIARLSARLRLKSLWQAWRTYVPAAAAAAVALFLLLPSLAAGRGARIVTDDVEKMRYAEAMLADVAVMMSAADRTVAQTDSLVTATTRRSINDL